MKKNSDSLPSKTGSRNLIKKIILSFFIVLGSIALVFFGFLIFVFDLGEDTEAGPCTIKLGESIELEMIYTSGGFASGRSDGIDVYRITDDMERIYESKSNQIYPEIHYYPIFTQKPDNFCEDINIDAVEDGYLLGSGLMYDEVNDKLFNDNGFRSNLILDKFNDEYPDLRNDYSKIPVEPSHSLRAGQADLIISDKNSFSRSGLYGKDNAICYDNLIVSYLKKIENAPGSISYDTIDIATVDSFCYSIQDSTGEFSGVKFIP